MRKKNITSLTKYEKYEKNTEKNTEKKNNNLVFQELNPIEIEIV